MALNTDLPPTTLAVNLDTKCNTQRYLGSARAPYNIAHQVCVLESSLQYHHSMTLTEQGTIIISSREEIRQKLLITYLTEVIKETLIYDSNSIHTKSYKRTKIVTWHVIKNFKNITFQFLAENSRSNFVFLYFSLGMVGWWSNLTKLERIYSVKSSI